MSAATTRAREATEFLSEALVARFGDPAGACLLASAVLARHLADRGIATVAVRGEFDEHCHWWLTCDGLRLDPTRAQFDDGPTVTVLGDPAEDECPYWDLESWPAAWTRDQVLAEAARSFGLPQQGAALAVDLLAELDDLQPMEVPA